MMNQEHLNDTTPTPKASLLLLEDELCKRESALITSRNSSVGVSSRIFYYYNHHRSHDDGVPFKWEMQPGTPIEPPPQEVVPPINPPPAVLSLGLPKPSISVAESTKQSVFPANIKLWKWKNLRKKYFSRRSIQNRISKDSRDGGSKSCDEMERFEESDDHRSSSASSSSSSSSKDRRLMNALPRQAFNGCQPWSLKNAFTN